MIRTLAISTAAFGLLTGAAVAEPKLMTEEQMDSTIAGALVVTRSGNTVWTVTNLSPLEGYNNGGQGKTDKAGPALSGAAQKNGLGLIF